MEFEINKKIFFQIILRKVFQSIFIPFNYCAASTDSCQMLELNFADSAAYGVNVMEDLFLYFI
jgi:hypothetical protein